MSAAHQPSNTEAKLREALAGYEQLAYDLAVALTTEQVEAAICALTSHSTMTQLMLLTLDRQHAPASHP